MKLNNNHPEIFLKDGHQHAAHIPQKLLPTLRNNKGGRQEEQTIKSIAHEEPTLSLGSRQHRSSESTDVTSSLSSTRDDLPEE